MKRLALALLLACSDEPQRSSAPSPSPAAAPVPAATARLAGCSPALPPPIDPRELADVAPRPSAAQVTMQTPSVTGALDARVVARLVRRHAGKLTTCYTAHLVDKPALAGELEVAFAINSLGHVASATGGGVDPALARCFADHVKNATFPPPSDGNNVQVTIRFELANPDAPPPVPRRVVREWTPFASGRAAPDDDAKRVAGAVEAKVRERMAAIESCFDGARGALRALIAIDRRGSVSSARAGGLGDSAIENCVERALAGLSVAASDFTEIACDFTRGGEAPLRVSPDAGYTVVELTRTELRSASSVRELPPRGQHRDGPTMLGSTATVLIVADPDAPAHGLEYALRWAPAATTLVAVKASGGAPVFLAMGDGRLQRRAATPRRVVQLRTDGGFMTACLPQSALSDRASLLDPRAMDGVMQAVVAACAQSPCEPTIVVGTTGEFIAKELVATTSAARRAGFESISIGGPACD